MTREGHSSESQICEKIHEINTISRLAQDGKINLTDWTGWIKLGPYLSSGQNMESKFDIDNAYHICSSEDFQCLIANILKRPKRMKTNRVVTFVTHGFWFDEEELKDFIVVNEDLLCRLQQVLAPGAEIWFTHLRAARKIRWPDMHSEPIPGS